MPVLNWRHKYASMVVATGNTYLTNRCLVYHDGRFRQGLRGKTFGLIKVLSHDVNLMTFKGATTTRTIQYRARVDWQGLGTELENMMTGLNTKSAICALAIVGISTTIASAGEKYTGKWNGVSRTSIEILSEAPLKVRYCYKTQCGTHTPSGDLKKMIFNFPKSSNGFPGARMTVTKDGEKYLGEYRVRNATQISQAILTPR